MDDGWAGMRRGGSGLGKVSKVGGEEKVGRVQIRSQKRNRSASLVLNSSPTR